MTNQVIQNIKTRRSIRSYQDKKIEKEVLREIIQAGRFAPSSDDKQPWKFIVITNKKFIQELSKSIKDEMKNLLKKRFILKFKFKELKDEDAIQLLAGVALSPMDIIFFNAPVLLFIVTKEGFFFDESCACCAQNMMLAANSMGIGSCWVGFASALGINKDMIRKIGVPENHHISATIIFGYPDKQANRPSIRKVQSDVIKWIE